MNKKSKQDTVKRLQNIITDYYSLLDKWVKKAQIKKLDKKTAKKAKADIQKQLNKVWNLPELGVSKDRSSSTKKLQSLLQTQGLHLTNTSQYGIETGALDLEFIENVNLRPIIKKSLKKTSFGKKRLSYETYILDDNLVKVPDFVETLIESTNFGEICIFFPELRQNLEQTVGFFQANKEDADKRFQRGAITPDNLVCVELKLHQRQWGVNFSEKTAEKNFIQHFLLHGEQHIGDFSRLKSKVLTFRSEDPDFSKELNRDVILEARVLVRQLLEKQLSYYTLSLILNFVGEWMHGYRSEYNLAGYLLFSRLPSDGNKQWWSSGIEKLTEEDLYRLALCFAYNNKNFSDMLTEKQALEAKQILKA